MRKFICFVAVAIALTPARVRTQEGKSQTEKAMRAAKKNIEDFEEHYGITPKPNESEEARINTLIEHIKKKKHEATCTEFGAKLPKETPADISALRSGNYSQYCKLLNDDLAAKGACPNLESSINILKTGGCEELARYRASEWGAETLERMAGSPPPAGFKCPPKNMESKVFTFDCPQHENYACVVYIDISDPLAVLTGKRNQNSECKDTRTRSEKRQDTKNDRLEKVYAYMKDIHSEKGGWACDEQKILPTMNPVICTNPRWKCTIKTDKDTKEVIPNDSECAAKPQSETAPDPS